MNKAEKKFIKNLHVNAIKAMRAGVAKAKLEHAKARVPMVVWKDGKVVEYKPWLQKRLKKKNSYAICVKNSKFESTLEKRKIYKILPDRVASKLRLVRIVDESKSSYLYPKNYFLKINLPTAISKAIE